MANKQIADLTQENSLNTTFVVPVQVANGSAEAKKVTLEQVKTSLGITESITKVVKVSFTSAEILDIFTTPKELVPAQANKLYVPVSIFQNYIFGTVAYASQSWRIAWDEDLTNGTITVTTPLGNTTNTEGITALFPSISATTGITHVGKSLTASTPSTNPTDGNGTLEWYLVYNEISIT